MSIIYGVLKERGARVTEPQLRHLAVSTERYATGSGSLCIQGRLGMGLQPCASHLRSALEQSPARTAHGNVLCFDGRLDNYKELTAELGLHEPNALSDSQIVLAAFSKWSDGCFSRFVGDWALALWCETDQSLYLARDHAGTRTLYFRQQRGEVVWSIHLDALINDGRFQLSHDYAACYLAGRFVRDLTPYEGIRSVPPAHYLRIREGVLSRHQHWRSVVSTSIQYGTDAEYEAHFLTLFEQSVERRTGPGAPILAQLSGGMDSTAIVCMSDRMRRKNDPSSEILDTVSFYDDSEISLNERPYFSVTESRRQKTGTHIDMAFSQRTFAPHDGTKGLYVIPGADSFSLEQEHKFRDALWPRGYRIVLSGIGGDEVLGGIPDPLPELADYLVSGNLSKLMRRSAAWSLVDRSPVIDTLWRTAKYAGHLYINPKPKDKDLPPWITDSMRKRTREIEMRNTSLRPRMGFAPHKLDNSLSWWSVMETLPHLFPQLLDRPEYRYPFLDKDLVNYLFSIPREQILRPGRRRSLMRRALADIIPHEILERRRKAYQLRAPLHALQQAHSCLETLFAEPMLADAGLVDVNQLRICLRATIGGDPLWWQALLKTVALELWLRSMARGSSVPARDLSRRLTA